MKTLIPAFAAILLVSATSQAFAEEHYEEKEIKIQKSEGFFDKDKQAIIQVGQEVKFEIRVYQDEFFKSTVIMANAKMTNTTDKKVKAIYSISFHDKDGRLVGCHQGQWDLDPKEDMQYGSGIIHADEKSIATVTSYKLRTVVEPLKK